MRTTTTLVIAVLLSFPALSAGAAQNISLERIAARAGYHYQWSAAGAAVVLSRPGMYVVLRPGVFVYQVNDHNEVAQQAPQLVGRDLFVDAALARHLEALARWSSLPNAPAAVAAPFDRPMQGSLALEARQLPGAEAIEVQGTAPEGAPVTITLFALLSPNIPTVLVSRHDVVPDVNGRYRAVVPIASAYERGTVLTIVATSAPGVVPAQAQLTTGAPNAGASVPLDTDSSAHS